MNKDAMLYFERDGEPSAILYRPYGGEADQVLCDLGAFFRTAGHWNGYAPLPDLLGGSGGAAEPPSLFGDPSRLAALFLVRQGLYEVSIGGDPMRVAYQVRAAVPRATQSSAYEYRINCSAADRTAARRGWPTVHWRHRALSDEWYEPIRAAEPADLKAQAGVARWWTTPT